MADNPMENSGIAATCILGEANTGKTTAIIRRIVSLLETGAPGNGIAMFCASPQAAGEARSRLDAAAGHVAVDASDVFVGTPRDIALRILDTGAAFAVTRRRARILSPIEMDCLIEDLKTSGIREGRIRKMLGFFFRCWSDLADDDPHWLVGAEEDILYTLLESDLNLLEASPECAITNLARKALLHAKVADDLPSAFAFDHVFVDDYQLLGRASQQVCCLLARQSVLISADASGCIRAAEPYPYAAGIAEFTERFPGAETIELDECHQAKQVRSAFDRLCEREHLEHAGAHMGEQVPEGDVRVLASPSPEDEFRTVAQVVADALEAGESYDIVVAAPNAAWAGSIASALRDAGVEVRRHAGNRTWNSGLTSESGNVPARLLCALHLVADPQDGPAWRTWCGFGNCMANSPVFDGLRSAAKDHGLSLTEALDGLAVGTLSLKRGSIGAEEVAEAYCAGRALCESASELRGIALLDRIAACVMRDPRAKAPGAFVKLCGADDASGIERAEAPEMLEHALRSFDGPLMHGDGTVAVLTYREAATAKADKLVVAGFVNGFIPNGAWFDLTRTPLARQPELRVEDAQLVAALVGSTRSALTLSSFSNATLETATHFDLKINRIGMENGRRMARISPSIFLNSLL